MGNCISSSSGASKQALDKTRQIDRALKLSERATAREINVLLLGVGESGKSTIIKQMRLIYNIHFTPDEINHYRHLVFENLMDGLHQILDLMDDYSLQPSPFNANHVRLIAETPSTGRPPFSEDLLGSVHALWKDPAVAEVWVRRAGLPSNLEYLVQNADRFWSEGFVPTESDILAARATTTGILENAFRVRDTNMKFIDVGGQRSERRKWINVFSDVNAILYIVSLSGYDECLIEDREANQMRESLVVFSQLVRNPLFAKVCIILFFNKNDLLHERLKITPLNKTFSDYQGPANDPAAARSYFKHKFFSLARKRDSDNLPGQDPEGVYAHITTAVQRRGMEVVMTAVHDVLTRNALREFALL